MQIKGKRALVLGASRGIGRKVALDLARRGAQIIATYYDWPEASEQMKLRLAAAGGEHLAVKLDLRQPPEVRRLMDKVEHHCGGLDILINNIERGGMPVVHGPYTPRQWDLEQETTLKAKWWAVHYAMPLLKQATEGVIVTLSSIAALVGRSGPAGLIFNDGYAAANRALSAFTETWARQGAPTVRVNELMIGFFETRHAQGTRGWGLLADEEKRAIEAHCLLARTGRLSEAVNAVRFLITQATYMTGAVLRLDGGYVLGGADIPPMPPGVLEESEG